MELQNTSARGKKFIARPSIGVIEPSAANEGRRQNEEETQRETIHVEQFVLS